MTFGLELDGGSYPEPLGKRTASAGETVAGRDRMLELLETRLALGGVRAAEPVRVLEYRARLAAALPSAARFYAASLVADPLGTARMLLDWRDRLIGGGWDGKAPGGTTGRLADLAAAERGGDGPPLSPGREDRLQAVLKTLEGFGPGIREVLLAEPLELLPPPWPRLLRALAAHGCRLVPPAAMCGAAGGDLRRLQEALGGAYPGVNGAAVSGEVSLLTASSDSEAAEGLAVWLEDDAEGTAVIAAPGDDTLDRALARRGLPVAGAVPYSPWRPALQVLPLAVALRWEPLDPNRLLEFLLLPVGPLPRNAASRLAEALARQPGIGGPEWNAALARIASEPASRDLDPSAPGAPRAAWGPRLGAARLQSLLEGWLGTDRFSPEDGIPREELTRLCNLAASWAAGTGSKEESLAAAAKQALELEKMLELTPESRVPQVLWESLLEQASRAGTRLPGRRAEARHVACVGHPGAVLGPVEKLVWWDFTGRPLAGVAWSPWSRQERAFLSGSGVELESALRESQRFSAACARAMTAPTRLLALVVPERRRGETVDPHPELARVAAALGGDLGRFKRDVRNLGRQAAASPPLPALEAGIVEPLSRRLLPPLARVWRLPPEALIAPREHESYSSLDRLLNHPYQWVLEHSARLSPGLLRPLPRVRQLLGSLAHRLLQDCLADEVLESANWSEQEVSAAIERRMPALLAQEGAPLLLPVRSPDRQRLSAAVARSVKTLTRLMRRGDWSLAPEIGNGGNRGSELKRAGTYAGGALHGNLDLLLCRTDGTRAVIDLKWGRRRPDDAQVPLQLLVYGRLVQGAGDRWPRVAHFFIEAGSLYPLDALTPDNDRALWTEADCERQWPEAERLWQWRREQLDRGEVEVTVEGTPAADALAPPPGARVPSGAPRFDDYRWLAGWVEAAGETEDEEP
ncbi:MAG: PD-(D/E)XK nuclease family protein [Candidatus Wallbacteria bacterium]|nr:PD-(D/E)XK nuclease family protein [Candidatus Wallbacteria bacterium]